MLKKDPITITVKEGDKKLDGLSVIFSNSRSACLTQQGGDTVQMLKTKEFLERKYKINAKLLLDHDSILRDKETQILHIFNLRDVDQLLKLIEAGRKAGKKVVLSSIYWDLSHAYYINFLVKFFKLFKSYPFNKELLYFKDSALKLITLIAPLIGKKSTLGTRTYLEKRKEALAKSDVILPNSQEELSILCREFSSGLAKKAFVVPNAVDLGDSDEADNIDVKDFVLQIGRIEPMKNQLNVVKAVYDKPEIPIIFIGRINDNTYYEVVQKLSLKRGNVFFIEEMPHNKIIAYYKKAKVHVLPSFIETTGLVSLEALLCGCEIVVSTGEYCPVSYYEFDKYGHLCNPYDYLSIKTAILEAYSSPKNVISQNTDYKHKFSYENVADLTYQAYVGI